MRIALLSLAVVAVSLQVSCDDSSSLLTDPSASVPGSPTLKSESAPEPGRVNGGGHIQEAARDVSLAGQAKVLGGEPIGIWAGGIQFDDVAGHWVIQLHEVSYSHLVGTSFRSTRVQRLQFFENAGETDCTAGVRVHLEGLLDGAAGWTALVVVVGGSNEADDTVRLRIWGPAGEHYDSASDFSSEATCAGSVRTRLDSGNLTVRYPG